MSHKLRFLVLCLPLIGCEEDRPSGDLSDAGTNHGSDSDSPDLGVGDGSDADVAEDVASETFSVNAVDPTVIDTQGGSRLLVTGVGFAASLQHPAVSAVTLGGVAATEVVVRSDTELSLRSAATSAGTDLDVVLVRGAAEAVLPAALEAWSPAELPGARLFDAAAGLSTEEPATTYEWQRLTAEISPDWRVRDGNTLTYLPSTGRFWMVGGWNGYTEPDGFSTVPDGTVYPPQNTSGEVWSTADGVSWRSELEHGHTQFERRHAHNTVLWQDQLWMIGGDMHQGYYNHDVVASADGVTWEEVLPPGTPPWAPRALQITGVYAGKLWTMGGQEVHGDPATMAFFNDVWNTEDGIHWVQVAPDEPESPTHWAHCGAVDGIVEFHGRMWLVGCGCDTSGSNCGQADLRAEVWSSTDGIEWTRHADPPWAGKTWHNVVVWDEKLWVLFGYTFGDVEHGWSAGNANEVWFTSDGANWQSLPHDSPVPGSHAQGVAVGDDFLLFAGGNYSFGTIVTFDKSAWRLQPFRGEAARSWTDRGPHALTVTALSDEARPLQVADAFGPGSPGLQFDGSSDVLALSGDADRQPAGRSVFWVARQPYLPSPWGWDEVGAPVATVLGGPPWEGAMPVSSIGLSLGQLVVHSQSSELGPSGETVWDRYATGEGLQDGRGATRFVGATWTPDGLLQGFVDGQPVGAPGSYDPAVSPLWTLLGGTWSDGYYGPNSRFAGTLGAVVILPEAADTATVARMHAWARGRFGVE